MVDANLRPTTNTKEILIDRPEEATNGSN